MQIELQTRNWHTWCSRITYTGCRKPASTGQVCCPIQFGMYDASARRLLGLKAVSGGCVETIECVHVQGSNQSSASNTTLKDSGHRVSLPNGTVKRHCHDGRTLVRFSNGDFKRSLPDGVRCSVLSDPPAHVQSCPCCLYCIIAARLCPTAVASVRCISSSETAWPSGCWEGQCSFAVDE